MTIGPPVAGVPVLISGGAGAVGAYAIQFAKAHGATVITTVSSPEKAGYVSILGADHVIDYRNEDVVATVRALTGGEGVGRVIEVDFAANHRIVEGALRPHGVAVVYGSGPGAPPIQMMAYARRNQTIHGILCYELLQDDRQRALDAITAGLRDGTLAHRIAARYPLDRIVAAHEAVESGKLIGNVVVDVG